MAFRFRLDEPIVKGFRRIGAEQIERALKQLAAGVDPPTEIHEARKCLKRIRALLRLGRGGLGEKVFAAENARFRAVAAGLAPARDDHVVAETLLKLEAEAEGPVRAALARLRSAVLAERPEAAANGADPAAIAEVCAELARTPRRFRRLTLAPDDISTLARGLARSYRRGRKGLAAAYAKEAPDDEDFHALRKSVQAHWRHMALLTRLWPPLMEARAAAARELSQILGDDHDLALLKARLAALPAGSLAPEEAEAVSRLVAGRQQALRRAAEPRARMLFAEPAKAHGRWIAALWEAAAAKARADAEAETAADAAPEKKKKPAAPAS